MRRRLRSAAFLVPLIALGAIGAAPLAAILFYVVSRGWRGLTVAFFTELPAPVGLAGGMANGLVGSLLLVGMAAVMAVPVGVGAGVYLSEYARPGYARVLRFAADVLSGVPSIVVGLLVYAVVVVSMGRFSALAGAVALALVMVPTLVRITEQMLSTVPRSLREAAYAIGATRMQAVVRFVLPTALRGLSTAVLIAMSRAMGETAPLLFTALGNNFWQPDLTHPIAALPLFIYDYALSPYPAWQAQAWTAALTLLGLVFLLQGAARLISRGSGRGG